MSYNGTLKKHWLTVAIHFGADGLLFCLAFAISTALRLPNELPTKLGAYYPSILVGAGLFPCAAYICGLYSPYTSTRNALKRFLVVLLCFLIACACMMGVFYLSFSTPVGRGVMLISAPLACLAVLLHHTFLIRQWRNYRERVALIVTCRFDELESDLFKSFWAEHLELAGFINYDNYPPRARDKVLGPVSQLSEIVQRCQISRVLCTNKSINDPAMCNRFCELRYSGVNVMPLISLCEEVYQSVPLELITPEWLLNASSLPHMLYIKKIKRGFDIVVSLAGLVLFSPFLALGALAIKLTSSGPAFYHQIRCGRFGRHVKIIKLRTMTVDAEKNGAVWAEKHDPRITRVGRLLRKYRIDEIPQVLNVLRGEMSFVGPRPERPEFVDELAREIPLYHERLLVQPGITGWAQVNYPYGNSIEDTRRKLEYDLYYMKHMSVFLDIFILMDTVRIVLRGDFSEPSRQILPSQKEFADATKPIHHPLPQPAITVGAEQ
jgi:exopolysaccharide biosynthesis polyprenyl glycosylphosphotransferase